MTQVIKTDELTRWQKEKSFQFYLAKCQ